MKPVHVSLRRLPIGIKLTLLVAILLAGATLFFMGFKFYRDLHDNQQQLNEQFTSLGGVLAHNLTSAVMFADADDAAKTLGSLGEVPDVMAARVLPNGKPALANYLLTRTLNAPPDWLMPARFELHLPIGLGREQVGELLLEVSNARVWAALKEDLKITGLTMLVFMLPWLYAAYWLGRLVTRPVENLTRTIRRITETRTYNLRVTRTYQDELGTLIDDFNSMLEEIARRDQSLEVQIELRTREFSLAKDEAEKANRAKSEFLSRMSHDLRTPLNSILGFAQVIEADAELNADHRDSVHEINKAGQHLLELVNEVLDLARIEAGHLKLSMEAVALQELVDECFSLIAPLVEGKKLHVGHGELSNLTVYADRIRLKEILLNLLSNAAKYNRIEGRIQVEGRQMPNGRIRIEVADTGMGIPDERQSELFSPFSRLGAEHTGVEGTGIGLAIVRKLAEAMDGNVGFLSQTGIGSRFWIDIAARVSADSEMAGGHLIHGYSDFGPSWTLLHVEDNPTNLKLMTRVINKVPSLRLLSASTPDAGLEIAKSDPPDLLLLDIDLPGMDGYELLRQLRALYPDRALPAVAVSAGALSCEIEQGLSAGFDAYIAKPIDIDKLLGCIFGLLQEERA